MINPKKLVKILNQDEFVMFIDEDNKSITNKKLLNDIKILIANLNHKKFKKKYLYQALKKNIIIYFYILLVYFLTSKFFLKRD